jgi:hypothetical protein
MLGRETICETNPSTLLARGSDRRLKLTLFGRLGGVHGQINVPRAEFTLDDLTERDGCVFEPAQGEEALTWAAAAASSVFGVLHRLYSARRRLNHRTAVLPS